MATPNRINYLSAVSQIKTHLSREAPDIRSFFSAVLEPPSTSKPPVHSPTYQMVDATFCQLCPRRPSQTPDCKAIFDEYLAWAKSTLSPDQFVAFLRFLSLYVGRKISHEIFVRMFLKFFAPGQVLTTPLVQLLPAFMSALQSSSFSSSSLVMLPKSIQEKLGVETILSITVGINGAAIARTISKCLNCLATGLVSPEVAKIWLLKFCKPDLVARMEEISSFSYFHPSRFPHELILCPEFIERDPVTSICQQFIDAQISKRAFADYVPVSRELLLVKLRGLRRAIRRLASGQIPAADELAFAYGAAAAARVLEDLPSCASLVISRLARHYEGARAMLDHIYRGQMAGGPAAADFGCWFKQAISREFVCFPLSLPGGPRHLALGSAAAVNIALALVRDFAIAYFDAQDCDTISAGLAAVAPLFATRGHLFIVSEGILAALVYLAMLAGMVAEGGDPATVVVAGGSLAECGQQSRYGAELAALRGMLKTRDADLGECFGGTIMRHVDLVLTRCARTLHVVGKSAQAVRVFPDFSTTDLIIITVEQVETPDFGLAFVTNASFSPCCIEYPVVEAEEIEPNPQ
jgi:hypothetical protein